MKHFLSLRFFSALFISLFFHHTAAVVHSQSATVFSDGQQLIVSSNMTVNGVDLIAQFHSLQAQISNLQQDLISLKTVPKSSLQLAYPTFGPGYLPLATGCTDPSSQAPNPCNYLPITFKNIYSLGPSDITWDPIGYTANLTTAGTYSLSAKVGVQFSTQSSPCSVSVTWGTLPSGTTYGWSFPEGGLNRAYINNQAFSVSSTPTTDFIVSIQQPTQFGLFVDTFPANCVTNIDEASTYALIVKIL